MYSKKLSYYSCPSYSFSWRGVKQRCMRRKMSYWNRFTLSWSFGFITKLKGSVRSFLLSANITSFLCHRHPVPISYLITVIVLSLSAQTPPLCVHLTLSQLFFLFSFRVCWRASKSQASSSCPNTDSPPQVPSWFPASYYYCPTFPLLSPWCQSLEGGWTSSANMW